MTPKLRMICACIAGWLCAPSWGNGIIPPYPDKTDKDSVVLGEVDVVSSRKRNNNVFQTVPTQQLSGKDMGTLGLQSLADAVRQFAGVNVRDYGGIGGMKTVSVHNLGAAHTAVSYDGITVSNTQAGQIDIGRFSLDNVEMLSVAIGQGSDMMQTARHYAAAGVMDIRTYRPEFVGRAEGWKVRLATGSWGQVNSRLRYWQAVSENTAVSMDADYMRADGGYPYTLTNGTVATEEKRRNTDIVQWHAEGNLYHQFSDSSRLDVKAWFCRSERGLPGSVILYYNDNKERLKDENLFVQTAYRKRLGRKWLMALRAKYTHSWDSYEDWSVKYSGGKLTQVNRQDEYYASATVGWQPWRGMELSVAQDVAFNKLRTSVNEGPDPLRFTSLTAVAARFHAGRLTVEGNVVGTVVTESLTESKRFSVTAPDDRHRLSPALSLSWRVLPDEAFYLRAMMKQTFRVPTFNDLYYLQIGNTKLKPEKANEYGVGMTWNMRRWGAVEYLALTADAYYNNVEDKLVAFPSTYIWKMTNFGKVDVLGADLTLSMAARMARQWSLAVTASMTWQEAKNKTEGSPTYGSLLPYTPKTSGALSAILSTPWADLGYAMTAQGKRYSMAQNTSQYELDAYMEHSLSLSRTFSLRDAGRLTAQFTVNNITDRQYEIVKYYPMPGRSFTGCVTWEW